MAKVIIHATVTLDGFMADVNGGVDWMNGFPVAPEDEDVVGRVVQELGGSRWRDLLRPGGRVGVTTFQPWDGPWEALDALYGEFADDPMPTDDRWNDDAQVEAMLSGAGFGEVRSETVRYEIPFADVDEWRRWSWATPLGGLWRRTEVSEHAEIMRRATAILEGARADDGRLVLVAEARYSFAIA